MSGFLFRGNEHQAARLAIAGRAELWVSQDVIVETVNVLSRKFPTRLATFQTYLETSLIRILPRLRYEQYIPTQEVRDPKDRHVLAAALCACCDYLVTGDADLLDLRTYRGVDILRAPELLDRLGRQPP